MTTPSLVIFPQQYPMPMASEEAMSHSSPSVSSNQHFWPPGSGTQWESCLMNTPRRPSLVKIKVKKKWCDIKKMDNKTDWQDERQWSAGNSVKYRNTVHATDNINRMTPRNKDENNNKSSDISWAISKGMHLKKQCPFFCFVKPLTPPASAPQQWKTAGELLVEGRRQGQT